MRHYYFRRNGSSLKSSWIEDQKQSRSDHEMKMKQWNSWSIEHQIYNDTSRIPSEGHFGPQTQTMGGRPWGIRFVVKTSEEDYSCPQFDSEGPRVTAARMKQ
jgi:hypothetical protein